MLELTSSELRDFDARDQRQDDVGREALFQIRLDAKCVGGVDQNASVLRRDDGFDDGREVVDVGQCLDAEQDIVEGRSVRTSGVLRRSDDCSGSQ